jgi:HAD superfamily hydrolase (TIGR01549 family)
MIKTIFFDVDDTLYDHAYHISAGVTKLHQSYSFLREYSLDHLIDLSHKLLEEAHLLLLEGKISYEESRKLRWQRFLDECGGGDFDITEIANIYSTAYYAAERATPGSIELLKSLKSKYTLGVISNNLLNEQLKKMHRIGVAEYFDVFAISEEVGFAKPDPEIFKVALKRAGVQPHEAILIGDSWTNDVLGAIQVGIQPIWFNRKGIDAEDSTITEIRSFEPIEDSLDHIEKLHSTDIL